MLHRYGISLTRWCVIYLEYLSCFWIPSNLIFKIIVGTGVSMPWKSPTPFWFREFSNHLMNVKSTSIWSRHLRLFHKSGFGYATFSTCTKEHKSTVLCMFITRRLNTLSLFPLFDAIRFHL